MRTIFATIVLFLVAGLASGQGPAASTTGAVGVQTRTLAYNSQSGETQQVLFERRLFWLYMFRQQDIDRERFGGYDFSRRYRYREQRYPVINFYFNTRPYGYGGYEFGDYGTSYCPTCR